MLINLRNALMAGKRLPYDAEVEYIQFNGTTVSRKYLDIGIKVADPSTIKFEAVADAILPLGFLHNNAGNGTWVCAYYNPNNSTARVYYKNYSSTHLITPPSSVDSYAFDGGSGFYVNGTQYATFSASVGTDSIANKTWWFGDIYDFNYPDGYTYSNFNRSGKLYSLKIYVSGVLIRDYIPVRKGTVGYLYDRVTRKLFGNAGTGDFVLGPDVVPVEYIESHGTEYIDTGLVATANNAFGAEVGFDTTVIDHGGTGTTNTVCICGANNTAASGFELRWQYVSASLIAVGGSYGNYVATNLTENNMLSKSIVAKNMNGHITYDADGTNIVDKTATVADAGFVTGSVLLFGVRRGTSVQGITLLWAKMKYAKFYHNDNIAESLIPVRVGSGSTWEGAMMDVLTRRIYRNAGTGAFGYGNDLKYPIPAE